MAKVDDFKEFVKKNPKLISHVKTGDMTWQKFYEIYDLYGENDDAWKDYIGVAKAATVATSAIGFSEVMNWFKNLDLNSIQSGVGNIQRVLGVIQDLSGKGDPKVDNEYKPRPLYKHFED